MAMGGMVGVLAGLIWGGWQNWQLEQLQQQREQLQSQWRALSQQRDAHSRLQSQQLMQQRMRTRAGQWAQRQHDWLVLQRQMHLQLQTGGVQLQRWQGDVRQQSLQLTLSDPALLPDLLETLRQAGAGAWALETLERHPAGAWRAVLVNPPPSLRKEAAR